jgi:8-oxo-dGTP pyrophosphatase MutT (NUDIX family)
MAGPIRLAMTELLHARPAVTVATIVERDGRYLLVEEETRAGLRLNQPAGHLEAGETLPAAAVRETLEETGWHVRATALTGIYRWDSPETGATFVRFAFAGEAGVHDATRPLDRGIVRALWLTYAQIAATAEVHRSPLVLRCIDDYQNGRRWPLDLVQEIAAARVP